jgi:hypothetical protein
MPAAPRFEASARAAEVWRLVEEQHRVSTALCDFPVSSLSYSRSAFVNDPRLAHFRWER